MSSTKIFSQEIEKLFTKLKLNENFSFSKYADGEWSIINNIPIHIKGDEFVWNIDDQLTRNRLIDSFKYKDNGYYVGISCPCCQGMEHYKMVDYSEQKKTNLTFANIFVNSNYKFYLDNFIPFYKENENRIWLICNEKGNINNLPFKPRRVIYINNSAFVKNYSLIEEIKKNIEHLNIKNNIFLFCAGPFGNMLSHQLWNFNKENTYLDIGSTLNLFLGNEGNPRNYYDINDYNFRLKQCKWG